MAEVLVLAEHSGETVKKVTLELLTLARRFGEPAVVWLGGGAEGGRERLAEFGAAKVYVADGEVKKVTLELLTAARRLGEPSVVWTGPGADADATSEASSSAAGATT